MPPQDHKSSETSSSLPPVVASSITEGGAEASGRTTTTTTSSFPNDDDATNRSNTTKEDRIAESIYQHVLTSVCIDIASTVHELIKTRGPNIALAGLSTSKTTSSNTNNQNDTIVKEIVQSRQTLYPELYKEKSEKEIQSILEKYAVDLPALLESSRNNTADITNRKRPSSHSYDEDEGNEEDNPKKKAKTEDDDDDDDDNNHEDKDDDDDEDYKMEEDDDDGKDDDEKNMDKAKPVPDTSNEILSATDVNNSVDGNTTTQSGQQTVKPITVTNNGGIPMDIWGKYPPKESKTIFCNCRLCGRQVSTSRFASHLDKCMGISTR